MSNIVINNYFPVIVLQKLHFEQGKKAHNLSIFIVTINEGCCKTKVYINDNQTYSFFCSLHSTTILKDVFVGFYS